MDVPRHNKLAANMVGACLPCAQLNRLVSDCHYPLRLSATQLKSWILAGTSDSQVLRLVLDGVPPTLDIV